MSRPDIEGIERRLYLCTNAASHAEEWRCEIAHEGANNDLRALVDYVTELEADLEAARQVIGSQPLEAPVNNGASQDYVAELEIFQSAAQQDLRDASRAFNDIAGWLATGQHHKAEDLANAMAISLGEPADD